MEFDAARLRHEDATDRDAVHAWRTVWVYLKARGDKKMPNLNTLLSKRSGAAGGAASAVAAHRSALHVLSAQYGIPLRKATQH